MNNFLNLGTTLSKEKQKKINGGRKGFPVWEECGNPNYCSDFVESFENENGYFPAPHQVPCTCHDTN